jgi:hypothetical protein
LALHIYIFTLPLNSLIRKKQPGLTPWQTSVNHLPIRQEKVTKRLVRGIILEPHDPIMNLFVGPLRRSTGSADLKVHVISLDVPRFGYVFKVL